MIKVLFAHQDPKITSLYHQHLARHFFVEPVTDGLSALRRLRLVRFNTVVSDYELPLISGPALLKFVRRQGLYTPIPFIFLSNSPDTGQALSLGANDWMIQSEATPDRLIETIYRHLKLNRHLINQAIEYGL
ncbi:MAG: response regulator [Candidatus Doudnabacteria bacterium]